MSTYIFKTNINCGNCIRSVSPALNALPEVDQWQVDTENSEKLLTVEIEEGERPELIIQAVQAAGFKIEQKVV